MGHDVRKPCLWGLQTIKAQTSLCDSQSDQGLLLLAYGKVSYLSLLQGKFQFLANLCS